jgi:WhiB family redox-sensing transcriptional regulator
MRTFESAVCAQTDPEVFYPEPGQYNLTRLAKKLCATCVELDDCFIDAVANNTSDYGIQAGLTARERRQLRNAQ